jgi:carboxylesterase
MPVQTPPVQPGAEPIDLPGGPVGVLLSHGFTGCNQSMRPWAEYLAAAGLSVVAPRLPGHGTTVEDLNTKTFDDWYGEVERSFDALQARCETVFAMGLSMGGLLVLTLAERRPDEVAGVVTVNAVLGTERKDAKLLPVLAKVLRTVNGIGSDIKKPGAKEQAYSKVPVRAFYSMQKAWPTVIADLPKISCPVLAYRAPEDHVVEPLSGRLLLAGVPHAEERLLLDSYHVATLDNDAPQIFEGSLEFVRQHAAAAAG